MRALEALYLWSETYPMLVVRLWPAGQVFHPQARGSVACTENVFHDTLVSPTGARERRPAPVFAAPQRGFTHRREGASPGNVYQAGAARFHPQARGSVDKTPPPRPRPAVSPTGARERRGYICSAAHVVRFTRRRSRCATPRDGNEHATDETGTRREGTGTERNGARKDGGGSCKEYHMKTTQICSRCHREKALVPGNFKFFKLSSGEWGWSTLCKICLHPHRKTAKEKDLDDDFTALDWQFALNYFGHKCAVCGREASGTLTLARDHWIPYSKSGSSHRNNIVPLCNRLPDGCNQRKNTLDPHIWLLRQYGETEALLIEQRIKAYFASIIDERGQRR
jgi:hypothetical protein